MNQQEFLLEMNQLLNKGAKDLDAKTIIDCMTSGVATILALATLKSGCDTEMAVESVRHDLDIQFTRYLRMYRDARRKTA